MARREAMVLNVRDLMTVTKWVRRPEMAKKGIGIGDPKVVATMIPAAPAKKAAELGEARARPQATARVAMQKKVPAVICARWPSSRRWARSRWR